MKHSRGMLTLVLLLASFGNCLSGGVIEMKFLKYSASCTEDLGIDDCDPMFTFCLDRPRTSSATSPCFYKSAGESGYFQDTNTIDFSTMTSIKGIPNPWIIQTASVGRSMWFVIKVRDDDTFTANDDMATLTISLAETVYPSEQTSVWAERQMRSGSYSISFQVRVYCEDNYFGSDCSVYCKPQDSSSGHYTCDPSTGNKICQKGWTGPVCSDDIDECALHYCYSGQCENLPGDYFCYCPSDYTGKNCSIQLNPCDRRPCTNPNTFCVNKGNMVHECVCRDGWEGATCSVRVNPCRSNPCLNGKECQASSDNTYYICQCPTSKMETGETCTDLPSPCSTHTCMNNATCVNGPNMNFTCLCMAGWKDENCTTAIDPCESSPCEHKKLCQASADYSNYTCSCPSPWMDDNCEFINTSTTQETSTRGGPINETAANFGQQKSNDTEEGFPAWIIVVIVLLIVIMVVTIAIICVWMRRRKLKERDNRGQRGMEAARLAFDNSAFKDDKMSAPRKKSYSSTEPVFVVKSSENPVGNIQHVVDQNSYNDSLGYVRPAPLKPGNHYTEFSQLNKSLNQQLETESEEDHYAELDEVSPRISEMTSSDEGENWQPSTDANTQPAVSNNIYDQADSDVASEHPTTTTAAATYEYKSPSSNQPVSDYQSPRSNEYQTPKSEPIYLLPDCVDITDSSNLQTKC